MGVSLHSNTHPLFMKCAVMAQGQSVRHTIQACFLCFFSNLYISNFSFTCLHTVELHCMSHEATQSAKQHCSANLHSFAKPGPLWTWLRGARSCTCYATESFPTCAQSLERRRNILPALAPLGPWHMFNRCTYVITK